ncbi:hypothetical protein B0H11DRAFT_1913101 [Mycena galericulata]|nr:hypothetical protein B0H11DRAFT_1913101 [Mycena galericulata]
MFARLRDYVMLFGRSPSLRRKPPPAPFISVDSGSSRRDAGTSVVSVNADTNSTGGPGISASEHWKLCLEALMNTEKHYKLVKFWPHGTTLLPLSAVSCIATGKLDPVDPEFEL